MITLTEYGGLELREGKFYRNVLDDVVSVVRKEYFPYTNCEMFFGCYNHIYYPNGQFYRAGVIYVDHYNNLTKEMTADEVASYQQSIQYPHIGFDISDEEYLLYSGMIRGPIGYIGPHEGRSMNLMKAGLKPVASLTDNDGKEKWRAAASDHGWIFREDIHDPRHFYVSLPGEEHRIDYLEKRTVERKLSGITPESQAEVGRILGYRESDIQHFLQRSEKLHEYRKRGII